MQQIYTKYAPTRELDALKKHWDGGNWDGQYSMLVQPVFLEVSAELSFCARFSLRLQGAPWWTKFILQTFWHDYIYFMHTAGNQQMYKCFMETFTGVFPMVLHANILGTCQKKQQNKISFSWDCNAFWEAAGNGRHIGFSTKSVYTIYISTQGLTNIDTYCFVKALNKMLVIIHQVIPSLIHSFTFFH